MRKLLRQLTVNNYERRTLLDLRDDERAMMVVGSGWIWGRDSARRFGGRTSVDITTMMGQVSIIGGWEWKKGLSVTLSRGHPVVPSELPLLDRLSSASIHRGGSATPAMLRTCRTASTPLIVSFQNLHTQRMSYTLLFYVTSYCYFLYFYSLRSRVSFPFKSFVW